MKLEIRYANEELLKEVLEVDKLEKGDKVAIADNQIAHISRHTSQMSVDGISLVELSFLVGSGLTANAIWALLKELWKRSAGDIKLVRFKTFNGSHKLSPDQSREEIILIVQSILNTFKQIKEESTQMLKELKEITGHFAQGSQKIPSSDESLNELSQQICSIPFSGIQTLAANDQLEEALEELLAGNPEQAAVNEIILQMSRLKRINNDWIRGIIEYDSYSAERNRLVLAILNMR